ncbi:uncharacterized protein LOC143211606 isoform X1 [Lasioglossum baleicum]|uniref:uncharacterized protein LOC143211606 isoform X1 n=1 Tax=Lasioglossum baleicum TaxID=434251 RepID=UPI003FCCEDC4
MFVKDYTQLRILIYKVHVNSLPYFEKGSARTIEEKKLQAARKKKVQNSLKDLSITVDVVKQGAGTSNTGNVARTFFRKAESVVAVTGLNAAIITRLHNIHQVITRDKKADSVKFKEYCSETAKLCIKIYPWYKLPASVHKVLQHGSEVLATFELPIGLYSEELQEANNKVFRKSRAKNSRMCSRKKTNIDIIRHMLLSSDPLISSLRIKDGKHMEVLSQEVKTLLLDQ